MDVEKEKLINDFYKKETYDNFTNQFKSLFSLAETIKYEKFRTTDPFPKIGCALLNSDEIIKYILTTGMIDNYKIDNVSSLAAYTCTVSGEYFYWDEQKILHKKQATLEEGIILESNSITFVSVKEYFRLPNYMICRFNLKVSHVYKGLLLGTGPIIDPGFCGNIYIPLHNLTANKYTIEVDAKIIDVEFTKMNKQNNLGEIKDTEKDKLNKIYEFKLDPEYKKKEKNNGFFHYVTKSLSDKRSKFYKTEVDSLHIVSSLPERIQIFEENISEFKKELDDKKNEIEKHSKRMEDTEKYVKTFTFVAFLSVIIACFALAWTTYSYLNGIQDKKYQELNQQYIELKQGYDSLKSK